MIRALCTPGGAFGAGRRAGALLRRARAMAAACFCGSLGCQQPPQEPSPGAPRLDVAAAPLRELAPSQLAMPFADLRRCRVDPGGVFLDLGDSASLARRAFRLGPFPGLPIEAWGELGHTRFEQRQAHYDFWLTEPLQAPRLWLRARAEGARAVTATVDNHRLGTLRASHSDFETLRFPAMHAPLSAGRHRLTLRWTSRGRASSDAYGRIQWAHLAPAPSDDFRPPVASALYADVVLGGTARHALVMRAPTAIACPVHVGPEARLRVSVGYWGEGEGVARVVAHRDGTEPLILGERRLRGGDGARFRELDLDLSPVAGDPFHLELSAPQTTKRGRVAFGEPRIEAAAAATRTPPARLALVVLASGLHRELLPPFDGSTLRSLRSELLSATRFTDYRVPTTRVAGVFATLLTGAAPTAHFLDHRKTRLTDGLPTLQRLLLARSGEAALFSGVPHTRAEFGFGADWNDYASLSPVDDEPAIEPVLRARQWLAKRLAAEPARTRLLVLHLRGGHPPWDVPQAEVRELPPRDYHGSIEARRGGLILSSIRSQRRRSARRLSAGDWTRLRALQRTTLARQDEALGALIADLEQKGLWREALFVFAGDVGANDPPEAPFGDGRALQESRLLTPLWIKFPASAHAPDHVSLAVTTRDIAQTIARAIGVELPAPGGGRDLLALSTARTVASLPPRIATLENGYSTRWGRWILRGTSPAAPQLCNGSVDPSCSTDLLDNYPLLADALWRTTYLAVPLKQDPKAASSPALLSRATAAALRVWGD